MQGRNTKISVQGIEGRSKQMVSVQDNQWRMLEEELLKIRDALIEYESKRNERLKRNKIESLETEKSVLLVAYEQDMREHFGIELSTSELIGYEMFAEKYKPSKLKQKLIECSRRR